MPSINLIPFEVLLARRKMHALRRWLIIGGAIWIYASIPVVRELSAGHQLSGQRAALAAMSEQLDNAHLRRGQSAKRLKSLRQEVARAEKLRYKRSWTAMIAVIADAVPEGVWLTRITTDPSKPQVSTAAMSPRSPTRSHDSAAGMNSTPGYDSLIGKSGPRRLLLEGQALDLEDIYALVDGLEMLGIFENSGIREVREASAEGVKVTRFTVECEW